MAKIKYKYNPDTCRYEPWYPSKRVLFKQSGIFLGISFVLASIVYSILMKNMGSVDELLQENRNYALKADWEILENRIDQIQRELAELIEKDDHNYRVILDSDPLDSTIREAGIGGREVIVLPEVTRISILNKNYQRIEKLSNQLDVELQSYQELATLLNKKIKRWAARPAIQPIDNRQLDRLHLRYGMRSHPLLDIDRQHKGLDFSAPIGTPVYATGDGRIEVAHFSTTYGNVIYLNHGYGYQTRYAHMSKFNVKQGDRVKRGQIIGFVGNTGISVGPHLHYEVLFQNGHINPINFFQRDLSNEEYERLIEKSAKNTEILD